MKSLAQPSFFRVFDLLLGASNPGLKLSSWNHDGVAWERERHSFSGATHGQSIEIVTVSRVGRRGWRLMVVKEYWWVGKESRAIKAVKWAKPIDGQRNEILDWFRDQEAVLDRKFAVGGPKAPRSQDPALIDEFDQEVEE
jgi:hypothetical protein